MKLRFRCPMCGKTIQAVMRREWVCVDRPIFFRPIYTTTGTPLLEITVGERPVRSSQEETKQVVLIYHPSSENTAPCSMSWKEFTDAMQKQFAAQAYQPDQGNTPPK